MPAGTDQMATMAVGRPAHEVLAWGHDVLEPELRAAVATLSETARRVAEFQFGWSDAPGSTAKDSRRTAIHPTLALLAAEAAGGDHDAALPAAVAVELTHGFAQLHDDVIAGHGLRPRARTACAVFGIGPVILAGSALQTLAFDMLAADHARGRSGVRMLSATLHDLLDARMSALAFRTRDDVGPQEYMAMASARTGALMSCACGLGALSATGDGQCIERLRAFGRRLGLVVALTDEDADRAAAAAAGGRAWAQDEASHQLATALQALSRAGAGANARAMDELQALAEHVGGQRP